jgi:VCBS repeat protein
MKRFLFTLVLCLPIFAAPAILRNAPAIAIDDDVLSIRTGDFNGDSHLDFAVQSIGTLRFMLGNGAGGFPAPIELDLIAGQDLEFADLDGDGDLDFVTNRPAQSGGAQFESYFNDGSAHFSVVNVSTNSLSWKFALADVTGDSKPDLIGCGPSYLPGSGSGDFGALVAYATCRTNDVDYVFDADGDGDRDILVANPTATSKLYRNNGMGGFSFAADLPVKSSTVAIGDFDDNDLPDIAWVDPNGDRIVAFASAAGTYSSITSVSNYDFIQDVAAADLNGDGRADLIGAASGRAHVWLTASDGAAGQTIYATGNASAKLSVGDFDEDGHIDVLGAGNRREIPVNSRSLVSLLRGSASGTLDAMRSHILESPGAISPVRSELHGVALCDVTGDGNLDLIAAPKDARLAVFSGMGDGTFSGSPTLTPTSTESNGSLFGDFNSDGRTDVVRLRSFASAFDVWLAQSSGTFVNSATGSMTGQAAVRGDFNGDGKQDLVFLSSNALTFHHGNGNGTFASPITTPMSTTWGSIRSVTGDFNGDGRDDITNGRATFFARTNGTFDEVDGDGLSEPLLAADLNGDTKLDLVCANNFQQTGAILTYLGKGDGSFVPARRTDLTSEALLGSAAGVADIDGDGKTDVVLGSAVLLGDGSGGFTGYARYRTVDTPISLALGDVDENGSPDLVSGTTAAATVIRTRTHESLGLPFTITADELYGSLFLGGPAPVRSEVHDPPFAPEGAVIFAINGVIGAFAEPQTRFVTSGILITSAGSVSVTANYSGDAIYAPATSGPTTPMTIEKANAFVSTTLYPHAPTSVDSVRLTGGLSGMPFVPPTGTLAVLFDGSLHSTVPAWAFDINLGTHTPGTHTVFLHYSGDANFYPQTVALNVTVTGLPLSFDLDASPREFAIYTPTTLSASFPNYPAATGIVRFYRQMTVIGEASIVNGVASISYTPNTASLVDISALYLGDATYTSANDAVTLGVYDISYPPGPTSLYLLPPCRILDTRDPQKEKITGGMMLAVRHVCGIPEGAKALAVNLTAVSPLGTGFLALDSWTGGSSGSSTLSYRATKTRANSAIVPISKGGHMRILNSGPSLHVIVDVTGYFK